MKTFLEIPVRLHFKRILKGYEPFFELLIFKLKY